MFSSSFQIFMHLLGFTRIGLRLCSILVKDSSTKTPSTSSEVRTCELQVTLIHCIVMNAVFSRISVKLRPQVHLSMLSWSFLSTSTPQNINFQATAFPHNHCRNKWQQWEELILSQWLSSILGENFGLAGDWTSDLLFSSPVRYRLSYGARLLFVSVYLSSLPVAH